MTNAVRLYYWRGKGFLGWLVRTATLSDWAHVAVSVVINGVPCYIESVLGKGVRLIPTDIDPPEGVQDTGLTWSHDTLAAALVELGQPYDIVDGVRAALGLSPRARGLECAELVNRVLATHGMDLNVPPTPENVRMAVFAETGNSIT